jgi:hypothetical protein
MRAFSEEKKRIFQKEEGFFLKKKAGTKLNFKQSERFTT